MKRLKEYFGKRKHVRELTVIGSLTIYGPMTDVDLLRVTRLGRHFYKILGNLVQKGKIVCFVRHFPAHGSVHMYRLEGTEMEGNVS